MPNYTYEVVDAEPRARFIDSAGRDRFVDAVKEMGSNMIPVPVLTKYADADVDIDIILSLPVRSSCVIYWGDGDQSAVTGTGAEVTYNHVYASAVLSYIIALTGNITSITSFKCYSQPVSGDISAFAIMTSLEYLWLNSTGVTGDIIGLITLTALLELHLDLSSVEYTSGVLPVWDACSFELQDLGWVEAMVSDFLIDLDTVSVVSTQSINIAGTNSFPNAAGLIAKASLELKGWTVTSTDAYGPNLVVNGGFDIDANWALGGQWSIGGGVASYANGGTSTITQSIPAMTIGKTYRLRFDILNCPTNSNFRIMSDTGETYIGYALRPNGSYEYTINPIAQTGIKFFAVVNDIFALDNVVIQEKL